MPLGIRAHEKLFRFHFGIPVPLIHAHEMSRWQQNGLASDAGVCGVRVYEIATRRPA